jgi:hypothetical protein
MTKVQNALKQARFTLEELSYKELTEQTDKGIKQFIIDHRGLVKMCEEAIDALEQNRHVFYSDEITTPLAFSKRVLVEVKLLLGFLTGAISLVVNGHPYTVAIDQQPFEEANSSKTLTLCQQCLAALDQAGIIAFREDKNGVLKPLDRMEPDEEGEEEEEE